MPVNPEFRRYLWLELSLQRMIAMPAVLAAVFFLVALGDPDSGALSDFAFGAFLILILLWGTRLAASAVVSEVRAGTWDWQRMSAIGPWQMTWGKLFGSTVFVWFGGLICLAVALFSLLRQGTPQEIPSLVFVGLVSGVLGQAVSLAASLLWLRQGAADRRAVIATPQFLGLLAGGLAAYEGLAALDLEAGGLGLLHWYGLPLDRALFAVASLSAFLGWSILGVYRLMQAELQVRQRPWAWPAFIVFLVGYCAGLPEFGGRAAAPELLEPGRLSLVFGGCLVLAYATYFLFEKDPIALRGLSLALKRGDRPRALRLLPQWLLASVLAGLAALALVAALVALPEAFGARHFAFGMDFRLAGTLLVIGTFGFLLRDLGIILLLNLRGRSRRADAAALVYLLALHLLIPGLLQALGLGNYVGLVSPYAQAFTLPVLSASLAFVSSLAPGVSIPALEAIPWLTLIGALSQVALLLVLLLRRWRRFQAEIDSSLAHEGV